MKTNSITPLEDRYLNYIKNRSDFEKSLDWTNAAFKTKTVRVVKLSEVAHWCKKLLAAKRPGVRIFGLRGKGFMPQAGKVTRVILVRKGNEIMAFSRSASLAHEHGGWSTKFITEQKLKRYYPYEYKQWTKMDPPVRPVSLEPEVPLVQPFRPEDIEVDLV